MIAGLINLIVYLLVIGILVALVFYVLQTIPLPEPINRIIRVAIVVIAALIIILLLLQLLGVGGGGGVDLPRIVN